MVCVSSSITSSASMTRSAAVRSPSSSACVPPAIASVVSAARRITSIAQLVEVLVERLARPRSAALQALVSIVTTPPRVLRAGSGDAAARLRSASILPRDRPVRALRTLGRRHPSLLVYLPATQGQRRGNPAPVRWPSTENGSRIPPPRAVPGSWLFTVGSAWPGRARTESAGPGTPPFPAPRSPQVAGIGRRHRRYRRVRACSPVATKCTCSAIVTAWSPMRS